MHAFYYQSMAIREKPTLYSTWRRLHTLSLQRYFCGQINTGTNTLTQDWLDKPLTRCYQD